MTILRTLEKKKAGGGVGGYRAQHMTIRKKLLGHAIFFASYLDDRKKTWMTNEMAIQTRC